VIVCPTNAITDVNFPAPKKKKEEAAAVNPQ
jgi:hypothetical protein